MLDVVVVRSSAGADGLLEKGIQKVNTNNHLEASSDCLSDAERR